MIPLLLTAGTFAASSTIRTGRLASSHRSAASNRRWPGCECRKLAVCGRVRLDAKQQPSILRRDSDRVPLRAHGVALLSGTHARTRLSATASRCIAESLQDIDGSQEVKLDRGAWAVAGEPRFPVTRGGTRYGAALRFSSCPREAGRISESMLGCRIQIKKVTTHPMFYWGVQSNREIDVCLVELMSDFDLSNPNFGTVRMNTDAALASPSSETGRNATVAGYADLSARASTTAQRIPCESSLAVLRWGVTSERTNTMGSELMEVRVPIQPWSTCAAVAGYCSAACD